MWTVFFALSIFCVVFSLGLTKALNFRQQKKGKTVGGFKGFVAGVFFAALFLFLPVHLSDADTDGLRALLLSAFRAMQLFTLGADFDLVTDCMAACDPALQGVYPFWAAALYVLAPALTFGFVLSLFNNLSAYLKYLGRFSKKVYIFSELNEKSLTLAADIYGKNRRACVVFNDVFRENEEQSFELLQRAKLLRAICFKKDILAVFYGWPAGKELSFFTIGSDETENLNQTLRLVELYKKRKNTHIYVFSTKIESELLLTALDKGEVKVRRINEVQSLINRNLYERGEVIFESARPAPDGMKDISAVVVGMGNRGTEMVKALAWFGQMDGYRLHITAFDRDPLAEEKFTALAPELMSDAYNGVCVEGEAQYTIRVHGDMDVDTAAFAAQIAGLKGATYVFVSLGDDEMNIKTAVNLRMLFERAGVHPIIQAALNNSQQKKALAGIRNYRGQEYDIEFIGDIASSFVENVIIDSELEEEALQRHLKWGKEEEFWAYEYNYRSSVASAIHLRARIKCGIPGADKTTEALTQQERDTIEVLEHRRWNAYMRAEGYVYSGSPDKSSRNDLAKMHHDLVDFSTLSDEDKRKDSNVGSK